jgi:hypothetical protein
MQTVYERFMSKVVKTKTCWFWGGTRNVDGYGRVRINGKSDGAHRVSYEYHIGPIPKGLYVCHKCDCPPCVNPDHLFLGTARDNARDKIAKGRHFSGFRTPEERAETMRVTWLKYSRAKRREIAAKIAAAKTGVALGPEHLASIRAARAKPRSAEYRRKLGLAHKGVPSWNKGIPMREEARQKLSESKKGQIPWNKGKVTPDDVKAKQSAAKLGRTLSKETRAKMSLAHRKRYEIINA